MNVDQRLTAAAERMLRGDFPARVGCASAAYSNQGHLITATHATHSAWALIEVCRAEGALIAALVTLARDGPGSAVRVQPPSPALLEALLSQTRRHAEIAVSGPPEAVLTRPLWELLAEAQLPALQATAATAPPGRFAGGMKAIAAPLAALAREPGVARARVEFPPLLRAALQHPQARGGATTAAPRGSRFLQPAQLHSVSLRCLWLAFEMAAEQFVYGFVDELRPQLEALGCDEADRVHVKQGFEALRNTFSALVVFIETRAPVRNECPFFPYDSLRLTDGMPMDAYLRPSPPDPPRAGLDEASRNTILVRQLASVLARSDDGGFARYLRQRKLYQVDLFDGGGAGHCPFVPITEQIVFASAQVIEDALAQGLLPLAPDEPAA